MLTSFLQVRLAVVFSGSCWVSSDHSCLLQLKVKLVKLPVFRRKSVSGLLSISLFKSIVIDYRWCSHALAKLQVRFSQLRFVLIRLPDLLHVLIFARLQEKCNFLVVSVSLKNEQQFSHYKRRRFEQEILSSAKG